MKIENVCVNSFRWSRQGVTVEIGFRYSQSDGIEDDWTLDSVGISVALDDWERIEKEILHQFSDQIHAAISRSIRHAPPAEFSKYRDKGDYHWRQYDQGTKYKTHADRVVKWFSGQKQVILDIGAGDGKIASLLAVDGHIVAGIDNEPEGVRLAQEHGVNVKLGDAYDLPYGDGEFYSVLMADVLEHFEFPEKALAEARRVLTQYIYITTPPKRPDGKLTDRYHWIEWSSEELKALVESCGFELDGEILSIPAEKIMYGRFRKV